MLCPIQGGSRNWHKLYHRSTQKYKKLIEEKLTIIMRTIFSQWNFSLGCVSANTICTFFIGSTVFLHKPTFTSLCVNVQKYNHEQRNGSRDISCSMLDNYFM